MNIEDIRTKYQNEFKDTFEKLMDEYGTKPFKLKSFENKDLQRELEKSSKDIRKRYDKEIIAYEKNNI